MLSDFATRVTAPNIVQYFVQYFQIKFIDLKTNVYKSQQTYITLLRKQCYFIFHKNYYPIILITGDFSTDIELYFI